MTPAMTSAGRSSAAERKREGEAMPRPVRAAASAPQRASRGPAPKRTSRGAAIPKQTSRGAVIPKRTSRGAVIPRRVSGPATGRPRVVTQPAAPSRSRLERSRASRPLLSAAALARGLPDHRWLDRLVRGRAWIPVLGVLLAGIVATQVEVLKLGSSMGRWIERTSALSARNQALQVTVARLSGDQRIERLAAHMGMVMPAPTAITFLSASGTAGVRTALARMRPADPGQFLSLLPAASSVSMPGSGNSSPTVGG